MPAEGSEAAHRRLQEAFEAVTVQLSDATPEERQRLIAEARRLTKLLNNLMELDSPRSSTKLS